MAAVGPSQSCLYFHAEPALFPQLLPQVRCFIPRCVGGLLLNSHWFISVLPGLGEQYFDVVQWVLASGEWSLPLISWLGSLLTQSRLLAALYARRACCGLLFSLLADTWPWSFSAERPLLLPGVFLPWNRTLHLSLLNCIGFPLAYFSRHF